MSKISVQRGFRVLVHDQQKKVLNALAWPPNLVHMVTIPSKHC